MTRRVSILFLFLYFIFNIIFIFYLHIFVYILSAEPVQTDNKRFSLKPSFFCPTLLFQRCLFSKKQKIPTTRLPHGRLCGEFTTQPHGWCDILEWETKIWIRGIYTPHIHWVVWGTGTPKNRDEVKRREVWECEGWVRDLEALGQGGILGAIVICFIFFFLFFCVRKTVLCQRTEHVGCIRDNESAGLWAELSAGHPASRGRCYESEACSTALDNTAPLQSRKEAQAAASLCKLATIEGSKPTAIYTRFMPDFGTAVLRHAVPRL